MNAPTNQHPVLIKPAKETYARLVFIASKETRFPTQQALLAVEQHVNDYFAKNPEAEDEFRKQNKKAKAKKA